MNTKVLLRKISSCPSKQRALVVAFCYLNSFHLTGEEHRQYRDFIYNAVATKWGDTV